MIEAVGPGVTALTPGQPVIAEGIIPDRTCAQCVRGNTNLCLTYDEIGFTRAGAAADQLLLPAQVVHPLAAALLGSGVGRQPRGRGAGRARRRRLARDHPGPAEAGGADRGRRRRHRRADHRAPAPAVLAGRARRLRAARRTRPAWPPSSARPPSSWPARPTDARASSTWSSRPRASPRRCEAAIALARRGGRVVLLGLAGQRRHRRGCRSTTWSTTTSRSPPASATPPPPGPKSRACSARAKSTWPR